MTLRQHARRRGRESPQPFCRDPARRPGARRRPRGAATLSALRRPSSTRCGRAGYRELAFAVCRASSTTSRAPTCARIVDATYTRETFGSAEITPLTDARAGPAPAAPVERPTLAFKDIALQLLGNLFEHVLARERRR